MDVRARESRTRDDVDDLRPRPFRYRAARKRATGRGTRRRLHELHARLEILEVDVFVAFDETRLALRAANFRDLSVREEPEYRLAIERVLGLGGHGKRNRGSRPRVCL